MLWKRTLPCFSLTFIAGVGMLSVLVPLEIWPAEIPRSWLISPCILLWLLGCLGTAFCAHLDLQDHFHKETN